MAPALDLDVIRSEVLTVVLTLAEDRIPNIRFNVAKALEVLAVRLATPSATSNESLQEGIDLVRNGILPCLSQLMADKDPDVRFFAEKAHGVAGRLVGEESQEVVMSDV